MVLIARRLDPTAPHEIMIVLDASLGQNAVAQALQFHAAIGLTGITMTKLDAGGKGGVLIALAEQLDVPVRFIGIGEQAADMDVFDAGEFAAALVGDSLTFFEFNTLAALLVFTGCACTVPAAGARPQGSRRDRKSNWRTASISSSARSSSAPKCSSATS